MNNAGIEKIRNSTTGLEQASFSSGNEYIYDGSNTTIDFDLDKYREESTRKVSAAEKTGATIVNGLLSLGEGALGFVEAVSDTACLVGGAITTIGTGIYDIGAGISDAIDNDENVFTSVKNQFTSGNSATKFLWDDVKATVSQECCKSAFDELYNDTSFGRWTKNNSYGYENIRGVGSGVGYVGGIVGITIATYGIGTAALGATATTTGFSATMGGVAATAGMGKGTEEAWNDGASTTEGLAYGTANAALEGAEYFVGGEINGLVVGGNALINSGVRVGLDSATGATDAMSRPLIKSIYKDESVSELFEQAGGWENVAKQAATAGAMSAAAEASGLAKKYRYEDSNISDTNISKISHYDPTINKEGLIDVENLPLSSDPSTRAVQEKVLNNEPLTLKERLKLRDRAVTSLGDIELKSDHVYRATSYNALKDYIENNAIKDSGLGKGYSDVSWYLGGTATRYGKVIIEAPADPNYFKLNSDYGGFMSGNPKVRHALSSNTEPVAFDEVSKIIFLDSKGEKVLKEINPKTSTNILKDVEAGNLLYQQDYLLRLKSNAADKFTIEDQLELDNVTKRLKELGN